MLNLASREISFDSASNLIKIPTDAAAIARLNSEFQNAQPWPSIVLDDCLNVTPDQIEQDFPDWDWNGWATTTEAYQNQKRNCADISKMPSLMQRIIRELNEPRFLRFVEQLTDIRPLIPDPYLDGAGLHSSGAGGILTPHTDFHVLENLKLFRQINIILYLNPSWQKEWGGNLGFYKKGDKMPTREVVPAFGRMVVFRTDHNSVHGFTQPIIPGKRRNSIALFYYTSEDSADFSGDTTTYWQEHGEMGLLGNVQLQLYKRLLAASTFCSKAAHAFNPHTGRWRRQSKGLARK